MVQQNYFLICIQQNFKSLNKIVLSVYVYILRLYLRQYFQYCFTYRIWHTAKDKIQPARLQDVHRQHQDIFTSRLITRFPVTTKIVLRHYPTSGQMFSDVPDASGQ